MNVEVSQLTPGVFGVSHGSGKAGEIIRTATGSWAGHAFLYLGDGWLVEGQSPVARAVPADSYSDAIWAWQMWAQLMVVNGWSPAQCQEAQKKVVARGRALIGVNYDWTGIAAFALEVLNIRGAIELAPDFKNDRNRVCSALVADAESVGGVPLTFVPEDGPGMTQNETVRASMPPNLVAPGMLLGLAQRLNWC